MIKYESDRADEKLISQQTRPRVLMCHQISLDDISADRRDKVCAFMYSTSKEINELTSGALKNRVTAVDISSKPFGSLVKYLRFFYFFYNKIISMCKNIIYSYNDISVPSIIQHSIINQGCTYMEYQLKLNLVP